MSEPGGKAGRKREDTSERERNRLGTANGLPDQRYIHSAVALTQLLLPVHVISLPSTASVLKTLG